MTASAGLSVAANALPSREIPGTAICGVRASAASRHPKPDNSVQWLAHKIVADHRFAEATVKFWWPAIMGREVAEPPEDEGDADFEGLLLAATAQGAEVARLARGFRRGFEGGAPYNLKDLLVEIVLSDWFRAESVADARSGPTLAALRNAGARRLLTPEELRARPAADYRRPMGATQEYRRCTECEIGSQCIDSKSTDCSTEALTPTGSRSGHETSRRSWPRLPRGMRHR